MKSNIVQKLESAPIILPKSAFWEVFKRFGRDEFFALIINAGATAVLAWFVNSNILTTIIGPISRRTRDVILSIIGPVAEKAGFFPGHFREAYREYKKTPRNKRDPFMTYAKKAVKGGAKSLLEDIIVHDPIYIVLMFLGLTVFTGIPAWILSVASFVIAVFAVAGLEVFLTELAYLRYKLALKRAGFGSESYFEARFHYKDKSRASIVFNKLVKKYKLKKPVTTKYKDKYYGTQLPSYNGRTPRLRLRERESTAGMSMIKTVQLTYTKVGEMSKRELDQHRYFPIRKDKIYYIFNAMPASIEDIPNTQVRRMMMRARKDSKPLDVQFLRTVSRDPNTILVSFDHMKKGLAVIEVKVRKDKKLLKEAMRFVMRQGGLQITHGKDQLERMSNQN